MVQHKEDTTGSWEAECRTQSGDILSVWSTSADPLEIAFPDGWKVRRQLLLV